VGFAIAYAISRLLLVLEYLWAGWHIPMARGLTHRYALSFSIGASFWIISAFTNQFLEGYSPTFQQALITFRGTLSMSDAKPEAYQNVYLQNVVTGATTNPAMQNLDAIDEEFIEAANRVLNNAVELIRVLIGAHQSAIAIVVQKDWSSIRKFFSLSEKYSAWAKYDTPATGHGTHGWLLQHNRPVRMTQAELEAHPEWKGFGNEAGKHPPMRGWLAAPIVGQDGTNWGLLQLSDKYEGEFTAEDEKYFISFAKLVSETLEALWEVRNLRKNIVTT
jgi:GAF domain-containing protein